MGEDNVLCLSDKMLPSKHSTTKYGQATMAVAMAACILGIVTMVTQVVVVLEVRNLRSELGNKMESVLDVMRPKGLRQSSDIIAENKAEDTGTKSWWAGKESHHRAKRSDHASKSTVRVTPAMPPEVPGCYTFADCQDLFLFGVRTSGVFQIQPRHASDPIQVYCEMDPKDNEGWTVIQQRVGGSTDFDRDYEDYRNGFGEINQNTDFWLGLESMHQITRQKQYTLRIDITTWDGRAVYADYSLHVGYEASKYQMDIGRYTDGTAGDGLGALNGMKFSTRDQDNDEWEGGSCAGGDLHDEGRHSGGWWYKNCTLTNLNGLYQPADRQGKGNVRFMEWAGFDGIKTSVMKIRPSSTMP